MNEELKNIVKKQIDEIEKELEKTGDYESAYCSLVDIVNELLEP